MNGKKAKAIRRAVAKSYHEKIMVPLAKAASEGNPLTPEQAARLPTPREVYRQVKRRAKRGVT